MRTWITLLSIICGLAFAPAASALKSTYVYDGFLIRGQCLDGDQEFIAEFPELCINGQPPVLTVTFEHDQPIWDNDASGCDPDIGNDPRCDVSVFTNLVDISFLPTLDLDPDEVVRFEHADFLGRLPCTDCGGPGPPFLTIDVVDAETGIRLNVRANDPFMPLEVRFPDGRIADDCCDWVRLETTVAEPATAALMATGVVLVVLTRRARNRRRLRVDAH